MQSFTNSQIATPFQIGQKHQDAVNCRNAAHVHMSVHMPQAFTAIMSQHSPELFFFQGRLTQSIYDLQVCVTCISHFLKITFADV